MTFLVSPSVNIFEFDLTTTIPAIAATPAGFSGVFKWGPINTIVLISSENQLKSFFGPPSSFNGETWFTASSFLSYGGFLNIVRTADTAGNTVEVIVGNTTVNGMTSGNTVILVANTTGINAGQILFYSNVSGIFASNTSVTGVNSSTITLSSAPNANTLEALVIFRDNITFSAIGQEVLNQDVQWALQSALNPTDYINKVNTFDLETRWLAKYPGSLGSSLRVASCDTAVQFNSNVNLIPNTQISNTLTSIVANVGSNTLLVTITPANTANAASVTAANVVAGLAQASLTNGDIIVMGNNTMGFEDMKVTSIGLVTNTANVFSFSITTSSQYELAANNTLTTLNRYWEFFNVVGVPPGQSPWQIAYGNTSAQDELHVIVVDQGGLFTGTPGSILEVYTNLSRATDAMNNNNTTNYYRYVINQQSQYIWWGGDRSTAMSNTAALLSSSTATSPMNLQLYGGADGLNEANIELGTIINGFSYYSSPENIDISLLITGKARGLPINSNTQLATWLINNIAEERKDCVVFCSPDISAVVNNKGFEATTLVTARNTMPSSSYGFMDSGYKYMYDRYNDVYRWVPLNGDMAGLCAQTDLTNAPWWSPAGFNRGNVKNVVNLAWNPIESDRDTLYTNGINPVVTFPNLGTVLFGDKTLFAKPSAFNRINVRRLFIVLEKAIATAAKFTLFEFNDDFTRSQFKAMINPFLQQIQGQRGITGFLVRCDATNNPPYVVQSNEFVCDIFIRPNYSINWVKLNFVNVPPTLSFAEAESIQF